MMMMTMAMTMASTRVPWYEHTSRSNPSRSTQTPVCPDIRVNDNPVPAHVSREDVSIPPNKTTSL